MCLHNYGSAFYETLLKKSTAATASAYLDSITKPNKKKKNISSFFSELECLGTHDTKHLNNYVLKQKASLISRCQMSRIVSTESEMDLLDMCR